MVWQKNRNQYHNTIIASVINLNDSHEAAPRSDCAAEQFGGLFQEAAEIIWLARFRPASLPSAPSEAGWITAVCVWRRMNSNNKRRNVRLVKQSLKACFFWPVLRKNWRSKKVQSDFFTPAEVCYNFHCNRTSLTLYSKRKTITEARKESLHHLRGISNISTQYVPPLPF